MDNKWKIGASDVPNGTRKHSGFSMTNLWISCWRIVRLQADAPEALSYRELRKPA
jgi:hypothetical protein